MRWRISWFFLTAVLGQAASEMSFLNRTVASNGVEYRYVVAVPADWTANRPWPTVLSLHGSDERGEDGIAQSRVGLGRALRKHPEWFDTVVVMPPCRPGMDWKSPAMVALILAALDASLKEFHGDPQRIYLTGLSMGGYGAWSLVAHSPGRFAAMAVVCGGIQWPTPARIKKETPYKDIASKVASTPIWVFHGSADRNVFVTESREMVKLLRELHADVRYTEYRGVAHNSWDRAYAESELWTWLFDQRLRGQ